MKMRKLLPLVLIPIALVFFYFAYQSKSSQIEPNLTTETEVESEKSDLIQVAYPKPNTKITSPLIIDGSARGMWFFEADFPIYLYDSNGNRIAQGIGRAQENWMTENFVLFEGKLIFDNPQTETGIVVLEKSNPSGLEEHSDQITIPVIF